MRTGGNYLGASEQIYIIEICAPAGTNRHASQRAKRVYHTNNYIRNQEEQYDIIFSSGNQMKDHIEQTQ